jgi:ABC-type dipeptide/oligopeptide/nickel transport system permease subunit
MANESARPNASATPAAVTGVQLARGIGVQPSKGFWAEAWMQVTRRKPALLALAWLSFVAFFSVFGPFLASGHPLWLREAGGATSSPLWANLTSLDLVLFWCTIIGVPAVMFGPGISRSARLGAFLGGLLLAIAVLSISMTLRGTLESMAIAAGRESLRTGVPPAGFAMIGRHALAGLMVSGIIAAVLGGIVLVLPIGKFPIRLLVLGCACLISVWSVQARWSPKLEQFNYAEREVAGEISATYTVIPWSPNQRFSSLNRKPPGTEFAAEVGYPAASPVAGRIFLMGTDAFGADVLSQILHACRLSISIGVVSTSIALLIGVTLGALMGYFGGWVDLLLYRLVEVFMAVPVLFLLIVSVAVLADEFKTTYTIMAIIGCFTWTGMARFTRAEFMKLRNQDFVQSAQASGLPLRSILFKHILPNGVAPVLVDTSFAVAAAIGIEATLSYLGLGPVDSPSWGRLLSYAISQEGEFKWWLAVFPGVAIFLTVLSYNFLGEALRDAIDPKLKKARV